MDFNNLSKEERLTAVYKNYIDNRPDVEASLKEGKTNERFVSLSEWGAFKVFALKSFFIDDDIKAAKQDFYTCGKLDKFLIEKYNEKILGYGFEHLTYALMSDSAELIKDYALLEDSSYRKTVESGGSATPMYILQCLIKDDWGEYERVMTIMKNKTVKKFGMELDAAFYEYLAERNKVELERVLREFVSPREHKRRNNNNVLINEFISHPALGYAKLAWMKGIEVEVKSPLVPAALLPVKPLENYKNVYPFLDDVQ